MNPEDRIRQLMEENAMLRAQLHRRPPYDDYQEPVGVPNAHGITPEQYDAEMAEAAALSRWQAEQSYMGNGMSDLMHRMPPRPTKAMRKEQPSPYFRKEQGRSPNVPPMGIN
jgi:hypothetical protein